MKLTKEIFDLKEFTPWAGAVPWYEEIIKNRKGEELIAILEDTFPEGVSDTFLNDLLWFEPEVVYEWLGMKWED